MDKKISAGGIIGSIFFYLSFLPYVHIIYTGFKGIIFGMQGIALFYGYMGMFFDAIFLTFLAVLPLSFIYQLIFGIKFIRNHKTLHRATICIIIILIIAGLLTEPIANMIHGTTFVTDTEMLNEFSSQNQWPW